MVPSLRNGECVWAGGWGANQTTWVGDAGREDRGMAPAASPQPCSQPAA